MRIMKRPRMNPTLDPVGLITVCFCSNIIILFSTRALERFTHSEFLRPQEPSLRQVFCTCTSFFRSTCKMSDSKWYLSWGTHDGGCFIRCLHSFGQSDSPNPRRGGSQVSIWKSKHTVTLSFHSKEISDFVCSQRIPLTHVCCEHLEGKVFLCSCHGLLQLV